MKVIRRCRCQRRHRSWRAFARCYFRGAAWVTGDGPFACISYCKAPTVTLWPTHEEATDAKDFIDRIACGGFCRRGYDSSCHVVARLAPAASPFVRASDLPDVEPPRCPRCGASQWYGGSTRGWRCMEEDPPPCG